MVQSIINTALAAERLATTFYYTALTSPAVLRTPQLGGASSDPNNPGLPPNGNPSHVRDLQAALDAEVKHAALLVAAGATSHLTQFYFPGSTFTRLGTTLDPTSVLGVLDVLETALTGLYIAAVNQLLRPGYRDLARLAAEITGIESEHRMLGRVIADMRPANNLILAPEPIASVGEAAAALRPFLTGKGFAAGATPAIAVPTTAQTARVIGKYGTRWVPTFF